MVKHVPSEELCCNLDPFFSESDLATLATVTHTLLVQELFGAEEGTDTVKLIHSDQRLACVLEFLNAAVKRNTDTPFMDSTTLVCPFTSQLLRKDQIYLTLWQNSQLPDGYPNAAAVATLLQRAPALFEVSDRHQMVMHTVDSKLGAGSRGAVRISVDREKLLLTAMEEFKKMKKSQLTSTLKVQFKGGCSDSLRPLSLLTVTVAPHGRCHCSCSLLTVALTPSLPSHFHSSLSLLLLTVTVAPHCHCYFRRKHNRHKRSQARVFELIV